MRRISRILAVLACAINTGAVSVTTAQYGNSRVAANTYEVLLTQNNVSGLAKFDQLCTYAIDGYAYAQPLVVDGVSIGGTSTVLVVATMHGSVYLFDAKTCGSPIWKATLSAPYVNPDSFASHMFYSLECGCLATPVVDAAAGVIYVTCDDASGVWKLYSLNLSDGTSFHSPVTIAGTSGGATFDSLNHIQRTGLLLSSGKIYMAFASWGGDKPPYQGWVMVYDAATLASVATLCLSPGATGSGIWMAGGGLAADGGGNVYGITGNGPYAPGSAQYGESFFKLNSSGVLQSTATPSNWASLNSGDVDLGSGRALIVGSFVMGGGKDGKWWLLNQSNLGGLQGTDTGPVEVWQALPSPGLPVAGGILCGTAFANNALFVAGRSSSIYRYAFNGSTFAETPAVISSNTYAFPGACMAYSSNGSTSGTDILWAVTDASSSNAIEAAGTLRAFNATTLEEIWNSENTNLLGNIAKFASPTVANGRVYISTFSNRVAMYGLRGTQIRGLVVGGGIVVR